MKVSTRIILGFGTLMILTFLALAFQVYVIYEMQSINRDLSAVSFRAAEMVLPMRTRVDQIRELSEKYFASPYLRQQNSVDLDRWWSEFEKDLGELNGALSSPNERAEAAKLEQAWNNYRKQWALEVTNHPELLAESLSAELDQHLETLRQSVDSVYNAIHFSIRDHAGRAETMGATAESVSWTAGLVALIIGVVISIALVRGITDPLRQLTRSARMVSEGQYWHRLPSDGRDEFSELARDFNAMNQRLGELDRMKKDFVSHVSHELKAPLASIRQMFHLLLEQIPGPLTDQQKRLVRLSSNSAERLAAMVGNLLDVSRMEVGNMEYEMAPVDLLALARSVAEEFEIQSQEKGVPMRIEGDAHNGYVVACDRDRMIQVIGNLFDNALKFSPRGGKIVATIQERSVGSDRFLVFSVMDSGPGVPDAHKERIFRKFHQVKQGKKISGQGVGLGLAICNSIVEAHDGRIWVEDNPSGGSIFYFQLQAAARKEATTCG